MTEGVRDLYGMDHLGPVSKFLMAVARAEALEGELATKSEQLAAKREELAVVLSTKADLERELESLKRDYREAIREKS
jgi:hypothetical protein